MSDNRWLYQPYSVPIRISGVEGKSLAQGGRGNLARFEYMMTRLRVMAQRQADRQIFRIFAESKPFSYAEVDEMHESSIKQYGPYEW